MSLLENPKRLAKLLASLKVNYSDRPLTPIETAEEIRELESILKNKNELTKRLPISSYLITGFLRLLNLPSEVQDIIVWGHSNSESGEISFTTAFQISKFENKNNVLKLVNAIHNLERPVTSKEIKDIFSVHKTNPSKLIEDCIQEILNVSRPKILQHHIFISGIKTTILEKLQKLSISNKTNLDNYTKIILMKKFPIDSILSIKIHKDYLRIGLTKDGIDYIHKYADSVQLSRKDVINDIIERFV